MTPILSLSLILSLFKWFWVEQEIPKTLSKKLEMPANSIQNASFSSDSSNSCNASNTTVTKTHPILQLTELANQWKMDLYSEQFAAELDAKNIWPHNRDKFFYPKLKTLPKGRIKIYII